MRADRSKLIRKFVADGLASSPARKHVTRRPKGTAIIDPPWPYGRASHHKRLSGHSSREYKSISIADLERLPIGELVSYVFLWTTGPFVEPAYRVLRAWGFEPVTMLAWVKTTSVTPAKVPTFTPRYGIGHWFRGCVEPIILAKRRGAPSIRTQWVGLLSPNGQHSRKPDSHHDIVEEAFPGPYYDVFGRSERKGWRVIGNEAPGDGADVRGTLRRARRVAL
jgi:N6-adenosine-specific RNA methylase IME4